MNSETQSDVREIAPEPFRFSLRRMFLWVLCISIPLSVVAFLSKPIREARRAALASQARCPLNQLCLALHGYHETYGQLPPAYIADQDGTPMHSWRVLILPYIEQQALYDAYDFDEPWNGPNNSKLADQMPTSFHSPTEPDSTTFTNIVAITGPGTAFPESGTTCFADFIDGTNNTILLTEIANSRIPWLKPDDLDVRRYNFKINDPTARGISAVHWRRPYVVFGNSIKTYGVGDDMPAESLRALTTIAGGEPITKEQLIRQGYLE